jgi:hypothetical protein
MKFFLNNMLSGLKTRSLGWWVERKPVFVLQMGRVGSASVAMAVRRAYQSLFLDMPVYHTHYLAHYDLIVERATHDLQDASGVQSDIERVDKQDQEQLFTYIKNRQPVKVISLVRDPIARNVSTFFYAFPSFVADWKEQEAQQALSAQRLNAIFESKQQFTQTAFNWFDEQLKDGLDIDVYAVPFDKNKGWQVYKKGIIELLVIRMEDLHRTGEGALREFLHLPHLKMVKVNTGEEREAYEMYRRFMTYPVSQDYLKKNYATQLARHFYTEEEIECFMTRWRNPKVEK